MYVMYKSTCIEQLGGFVLQRVNRLLLARWYCFQSYLFSVDVAATASSMPVKNDDLQNIVFKNWFMMIRDTNVTSTVGQKRKNHNVYSNAQWKKGRKNGAFMYTTKCKFVLPMQRVHRTICQSKN